MAKRDPAAVAVHLGWQRVGAHPLLAGLARYTRLWRPGEHVPGDGWAVIEPTGDISVHPTRLATAAEWEWVFTHLLLHLGLNHHEPSTSGTGVVDEAHRVACDVVAVRLQEAVRLGTCPLGPLPELPGGDERTLAGRWRDKPAPATLRRLGTAGTSRCVLPARRPRGGRLPDFPALFADGLTEAVTAAVDEAGGAEPSSDHWPGGRRRPWQLARSWFVSGYPLLGAVVGSLTVVADAGLARRWGIQVAAVSPTAGELYVNPHVRLDEHEWRFVMAHEALHAALAHHARIGVRDPELFNIACDFVVNGWLVEMGVGSMPSGALYDPALAGLSAEAVYDHIAAQARRYRRLTTLRGRAGGDVLLDGLPGAVGPAAGLDLDAMLRRGLVQGLDLHVAGGRGTLPAGLVEEIRALGQPPVPWDVELARWFDEHFPALDRHRSYARPSRRSAATPDIPRPGVSRRDEPAVRRTFGVVLDTSASMDRRLLGKALGAIASYAAAHDVPAARVVYCDAAAHDAGYLSPDEIAGRIRVRGRGGTVLQPGVDLLQRAPDFPGDGAILVITDGDCDHVRVRRSHAYLLPAGGRLPFTPRGPVFHVS